MGEHEKAQEVLLKQRAHMNKIAEEVRKLQEEIDLRNQQVGDDKENEMPYH